jgi:hypothetical protein
MFPTLIGYRKNFPKFTCPEWIDFSGPQAGFCKSFQGQNCSKEGYWKDF